ncbi:hypothetical protein A374_17684 [Fictibacillus macauensis ZFHKF-1]|uniref:MotA/TolQ/ExbB proton channel domain-containing protein n=1 Tax=Fictibacillus macauensis ZFHKF-1 TaxID=1196324 RepID=I8UAB1_9BACL|nr:hypothetical protein [Fictibacillus macauensis]EIT83890.1 hypothetical protein A374_17684 [Fictibacillus macauensis ZFHKF-1]
MDTVTMIVVGIIACLTFIGMIGHLQTSSSLRKWLRELDDIASGRLQAPHSPWLQKVCDDYRQHERSGIEPNTQALIEKYYLKEKLVIVGLWRVPVGNVQRLLQQLPSFTIILGVLGTFVGLTMALFSMQSTLFALGGGASAGVTMNSIITSLTAPFQGMSTAFITSIAGVSAALLLTVLSTGFFSRGTSLSYLHGKIMTDCEAYLDHTFRTLLLQEKPQDSVERLLDRLATKIEESFHSTIGHFGAVLTELTSGLQQSVTDVKTIFETQRDYTHSFAASAGALEHFGARFREAAEKQENIARSSESSVAALTGQISTFEQQIKKVSEQQQAGQQKFEMLLKRSDQALVDAGRRSEEFGQQLLRIAQEQLQHYSSVHEALEGRLQQKQEEWYYRYAEKQGDYGRAANDFASSVGQLEKSFYHMLEQLKRDLPEQLRTILERERQLQQPTNRDDDRRELARMIETIYHGITRELSTSTRTLDDMHHLLQRMYQTAMDRQTVYSARDTTEALIPPTDPRRR